MIKISYSFQILFGTKITTFLPFSPCNQGDWKMYLIKIELSKINHNFEILFRTEITTFLPFSPCNKDVRDQNLIV